MALDETRTAVGEVAAVHETMVTGHSFDGRPDSTRPSATTSSTVTPRVRPKLIIWPSSAHGTGLHTSTFQQLHMCHLGYMGQLHNYYMILMGWGVTFNPP